MILSLLSLLHTAAADNGPVQDRVSGSLDTAAGLDTGLHNPFGRTPKDQCSTQVLRNGVQLPPMGELYRIWNGEKAWGTPEMIQAIVTSAEEMAWLMPSADPLIVGDISTRYGGLLHGHKSHRSGLDADIGIFTVGGHQPQGGGFEYVTPETMDYETNWLFWRSLLETGMVDRILLDQKLIDAMREHVVDAGELSHQEAQAVFPPRGTPRLWAHTGVFHHAPGHANHIHLRVLCGASELGW
jgi:hypothetical protein